MGCSATGIPLLSQVLQFVHAHRVEETWEDIVVGAHLQSFKKFLLATGHSSVYKSTTRSPLLVSSSTAIASPL